ncbi:hypothetical protein AMECASPLE_026710 [Ameca splendens]|uniref:Uncharacterized protein n=1 Tax=Ameca splendens TaxID=208324 RepID=A0ABV0XI14_9TELE
MQQVSLIINQVLRFKRSEQLAVHCLSVCNTGVPGSSLGLQLADSKLQTSKQPASEPSPSSNLVCFQSCVRYLKFFVCMVIAAAHNCT